MTTVRVEQWGEELIIRLTPEATRSLALGPGDEVHLARTVHGEVSLAPSDMDHQLRADRGRAFLRHLRT